MRRAVSGGLDLAMFVHASTVPLGVLLLTVGSLLIPTRMHTNEQPRAPGRAMGGSRRGRYECSHSPGPHRPTSAVVPLGMPR